MRKIFGWTALVLVAAFLSVFLILPVVTALGAGMSWTYLREVWLHPVYREGLLNGLSIAVIVTCLSFAFALPTAWISVRFRFRGKALLEGMLLAPLILPPFVGALGVQQ
ncbi:MAG: hypothetical protein JNM63_04105, partial [Spirochaetia bacterium]|nr:hypothetical protein [Spirochaetia bacterium]